MTGAQPADQRGFTLVELITTMAILGIVLTGVTTLFVSGTKAQTDLDNRFQAQTELRVGLDKLRKDIHVACSGVDSSGTALVDGSTYSSVTLYLPTACDSTNAITWCTQGSGTRYGLYRATGTSCTGATRYADYLTTGSVFTYHGYNYQAQAGVYSYSLARLHVNLPDNVKGSGTDTYTLADDIVFRNSPRCTVGTDCP